MLFSHISLKRQEKRNYLSLWEMVLYSVYRKRPHHGRYPRSVWFPVCRKYWFFFSHDCQLGFKFVNFLRLTAIFLTGLRLTVNPMETLDWVTCKMWNKNGFRRWQLEYGVLVFEEWGKPEKTSHGKILEVRINLVETAMGRALSLRIPLMFQLRCLMKLTRDIHRCGGEQG